MTHYLELGHTLYALCGAAITKAEHATDPDCSACRTALEALNAQTAEERFGTADDHQPPQQLPRRPVQSSNIRSVGYANGVLHVEFKSGAVHAYYDFTANDHASLLAAPSIGKHYAKYIRGQFRSEKLAPEPPRPVRGFDAFTEDSHEDAAR